MALDAHVASASFVACRFIALVTIGLVAEDKEDKQRCAADYNTDDAEYGKLLCVRDLDGRHIVEDTKEGHKNRHVRHDGKTVSPAAEYTTLLWVWGNLWDHGHVAHLVGCPAKVEYSGHH
jgi:hypothetical protein